MKKRIICLLTHRKYWKETGCLLTEKDVRSLCDFVGLEYKEQISDEQASLEKAMEKLIDLETQVKKLKDRSDHRSDHRSLKELLELINDYLGGEKYTMTYDGPEIRKYVWEKNYHTITIMANAKETKIIITQE